MQSLSTLISAQHPAYLREGIDKQYAQVRARMLKDSVRLHALEFRSCLKTVRGQRIRRIHDLDHLKRRLRFLAKTLGEKLENDVFVKIQREKDFRIARHALRVFRVDMMTSDGRPFVRTLDLLENIMKKHGFTPRRIGTTRTELRSFQKKCDAWVEHCRKATEARAVRRRERSEKRN